MTSNQKDKWTLIKGNFPFLLKPSNSIHETGVHIHESILVTFWKWILGMDPKMIQIFHTLKHINPRPRVETKLCGLSCMCCRITWHMVATALSSQLIYFVLVVHVAVSTNRGWALSMMKDISLTAVMVSRRLKWVTDSCLLGHSITHTPRLGSFMIDRHICNLRSAMANENQLLFWIAYWPLTLLFLDGLGKVKQHLEVVQFHVSRGVILELSTNYCPLRPLMCRSEKNKYHWHSHTTHLNCKQHDEEPSSLSLEWSSLPVVRLHLEIVHW